MLADPVYHTFFPPWVVYPFFHFDVQCLVLFFPVNWNMLTITATFYCFWLFPDIFPSSCLQFSLFTEFHQFIPSEKWQRTTSSSSPQPPLAGPPFPGCLLPFYVPVTEVSYLHLCQCHIPSSHLPHPALIPSLTLPFCLSLLGSFQFSQ